MPGYGCQVHHAQTDWANGGQTNIDEEALACGPHNRLITEAAGEPENLRTAGCRAVFYLVNGGKHPNEGRSPRRPRDLAARARRTRTAARPTQHVVVVWIVDP